MSQGPLMQKIRFLGKKKTVTFSLRINKHTKKVNNRDSFFKVSQPMIKEWSNTYIAQTLPDN